MAGTGASRPSRAKTVSAAARSRRRLVSASSVDHGAPSVVAPPPSRALRSPSACAGMAIPRWYPQVAERAFRPPLMSSEPERQHPNVTLAVLALSALAFALLQSLVAPALPAIQHQL